MGGRGTSANGGDPRVVFLDGVSLEDYKMALSSDDTAKYLVQAGGHMETALSRVRPS